MSAAIARRINKLEKKDENRYLTLNDFLRHFDTGEPLPDRPVDPKLKEYLERSMDAKH